MGQEQENAASTDLALVERDDQEADMAMLSNGTLVPASNVFKADVSTNDNGETTALIYYLICDLTRTTPKGCINLGYYCSNAGKLFVLISPRYVCLLQTRLTRVFRVSDCSCDDRSNLRQRVRMHAAGQMLHIAFVRRMHLKRPEWSYSTSRTDHLPVHWP